MLALAAAEADWQIPWQKSKMEPTNPNANTYSKTNAQTFFDTLVGDTLVERSSGTLSCDTLVTVWDTLVGHSCGTLLRTLVQHFCGTLGHSRTALTYSDAIWPLLRPQLLEAACRTTCVL